MGSDAVHHNRGGLSLVGDCFNARVIQVTIGGRTTTVALLVFHSPLMISE